MLLFCRHFDLFFPIDFFPFFTHIHIHTHNSNSDNNFNIANIIITKFLCVCVFQKTFIIIAKIISLFMCVCVCMIMNKAWSNFVRFLHFFTHIQKQQQQQQRFKSTNYFFCCCLDSFSFQCIFISFYNYIDLNCVDDLNEEKKIHLIIAFSSSSSSSTFIFTFIILIIVNLESFVIKSICLVFIEWRARYILYFFPKYYWPSIV